MKMPKIKYILLAVFICALLIVLSSCIRKANGTEPEVPEVSTKAEETTKVEIATEETTSPADVAPVTTVVTTAQETTVAVTEAPVTSAPVTEYVSQNKNPDIFDNTLFIGDSRVVGIELYNDMGGAVFFSKTGLSTAGVYYESIEVPGYGTCNFDRLLSMKTYDRVYISLGINEIGNPVEGTVARYSDIISKIQAKQPSTTVYLMACLHIKKSRSDVDDIFTNSRVNALNEKLKGISNGSNIKYIDPNVLFDDENGALRVDIASDDFHLQVSGYQQWAAWLRDN